MKSKIDRFRARFVEHSVTGGLFRDRHAVLAAVSGGADSIVLMHMLNDCAGALGVRTIVAHVNHMIRPEADRDLEFVEQAANSLGLPFVSARVDVPALANATRRSLEHAAREARYDLLTRMAADNGCDTIATGHSMTDQAETLLMRMIRGTGPLGLAGISVSTPGGVVRPLLCVTASEIRDLACDQGWKFVMDATNDDEYHLRNRIRARLLPMLREFNPNIECLLSGLAEDAARITTTVEDLVSSMIRRDADGTVTVARRDAALDGLDAYAVREAFRLVTGEPLGLSRTHIDTLTRLLGRWSGPAEVHLPRRTVVFSKPQGLVFSRDFDDPPRGSARGKKLDGVE